MNEEQQPGTRDQIKLTKAEYLYDIRDKDGKAIDYETANGRQLFEHYRHNMTNHDTVVGSLIEEGRNTEYERHEASIGSAEQVIEYCRDEHIKVNKDAKLKGNILKNLMQKAGVGTATALAGVLDSWSEGIKKIAKLENSQRGLQTWNDTYRVQRELVKKVLADDGIAQETRNKVDAIFGTRSSGKAIQLGAKLFNLEESEVLKLVKSAIRYAKNVSEANL